MINQGQSFHQNSKIDQTGIVVPPYGDSGSRPGVPLALGLTKGPVDPLPALSLLKRPSFIFLARAGLGLMFA